MSETGLPLNKEIIATINLLAGQFAQIPPQRQQALFGLARCIRSQPESGPVNLLFICTHNSRRSQMAQLWAQAAADYYGLAHVSCYSGGTEATSFYPSAVGAMRSAGFGVEATGGSGNPVYRVSYANQLAPLQAFSKTYDDAFNPQSGFLAVMTCDHASEACPVVAGAAHRVPITYLDPKVSDGTSDEAATYLERCQQIGREMLYLFAQVPSAGASK